ncbi:MAG TPA: hypothetical protein VGP04_12245, partial [Pseudonocardiaceae bacterium]|nr:hypothetical protein [Pseudonocardiaceae bacterium]
MWIGGQDGTKQATDDCENEFTGRVPAQVDPPDNLAVMAGPIFANQRCNIPAQPADMGTYKDAGGDGSDGGSGSGSGHHGHHGHHDSDNSDSGGDNSDSGGN